VEEKRCKHFLVEGTCWLCNGNPPTPYKKKIIDLIEISSKGRVKANITNPSFGIWPDDEN
jgi:hypothetical protein